MATCTSFEEGTGESPGKRVPAPAGVEAACHEQLSSWLTVAARFRCSCFPHIALRQSTEVRRAGRSGSWKPTSTLHPVGMPAQEQCVCTGGGPSQAGGRLPTAGVSDDTWLLSITHFVQQGQRKADVAVFWWFAHLQFPALYTVVRHRMPLPWDGVRWG